MTQWIKRTSWIDLLLLGLLGLLPLTWFKAAFINGGDFMFPMRVPAHMIEHYTHIWVDQYALGLTNARLLPQFPLMALIYLFQQIGISPAIFERLLFCLLFGLSGLGVYLYVVRFIPTSSPRLTGLFAATFYMMNPYTLIFNWHILDGNLFAYTSLVWSVYTFQSWIQSDKPWYLVAFCLIPTFSGYAYSNPLEIPILWALILSTGFTFSQTAIFNKPLRNRYLFGLVTWILANAWWLWPLLTSLREEYSGLSASLGTPFDTLRSFSQTTSLLNLMRLSNLHWTFFDSLQGSPYFTYASTYQTAAFLLISLLIGTFIVLSISRKNTPKVLLWWFAFLLIFQFLSKGSQPPLGEIFYKIVFRFPFLSAFRGPIHKLGIILCFFSAISLGCGVTVTYAWLKERLPRFANANLVGTALLLFVVYAFPFWTGELIHMGGTSYPSFHVETPSYFHDLNRQLNQASPGSRFAPIPMSPTMNVAYSWDTGYIGGDPSLHLLDRPGTYNSVDEYAQLPSFFLRDHVLTSVANLYKIQNVNRVVLHHDIHPTLWDIFTKRNRSSQFFHHRLSQQRQFSLLASIGPLELFELDQQIALPTIFAATHTSILIGDTPWTFIPLAETPWLDHQPACVTNPSIRFLTEPTHQPFFKDLVYVNADPEQLALLTAPKTEIQNLITDGYGNTAIKIKKSDTYVFFSRPVDRTSPRAWRHRGEYYFEKRRKRYPIKLVGVNAARELLVMRQSYYQSLIQSAHQTLTQLTLPTAHVLYQPPSSSLTFVTTQADDYRLTLKHVHRLRQQATGKSTADKIYWQLSNVQDQPIQLSMTIKDRANKTTVTFTPAHPIPIEQFRYFLMWFQGGLEFDRYVVQVRATVKSKPTSFMTKTVWCNNEYLPSSLADPQVLLVDLASAATPLQGRGKGLISSVEVIVEDTQYQVTMLGPDRRFKPLQAALQTDIPYFSQGLPFEARNAYLPLLSESLACFYEVDGQSRWTYALSEVPADVSTVFKPHADRYLDIDRLPVLDLSVNIHEGSNAHSNVLLKLGLDFNQDLNVDQWITHVEPLYTLRREGKRLKRNLSLSVRIRDIVRQQFPKTHTIWLTQVEVGTQGPNPQRFAYTPVHYYLGANHISRSTPDRLQVRLNGRPVTLNSTGSGNWTTPDYIRLPPGSHVVTLEGPQAENADVVIPLFYAEPRRQTPQHETIDVKRISPTHFQAQLTARQPTTLVFSNAFHNGWVATANHTQVNPFKVNGFANGFFIHQTGPLSIDLEYRPQQSVHQGLIATACCFAFLLAWSFTRKS